MSLSINLPYRVRTILKNNENEMIDFSIAILTRNNERTISQLLDSLDDFRRSGGEVVVLDLDSTDNTPQIILDKGIRLEKGSSFIRYIDDDMITFINDRFLKVETISLINDDREYIDYGQAREHLQSLVSNDMVLMIDPRTHFLSFNFNEIKQDISGFNRVYFTAYNSENAIYQFYDRRVFNWKNIVFEELIAFENETTRYISNEVLMINIIKENEEIIDNYNSLIINCFLDENNPILIKKLADILSKRDYFHSSVELYNKHLEVCLDPFQRSDSLYKIGLFYFTINDYLKGIKYCHDSFVEFGGWRTPLMKIADYYYSIEDYNKSLIYAEASLHINKPDFDTKEEEFIYQDGPHSILYVAYWWIGDKEKGKYHFDKALELAPYNHIYLSETSYHYEYLGNNIVGYLSFQNTQTLYNLGKKFKSVLEIYPENARGTHALIKGCDGIVTVVRKESDNEQFILDCENPGNLRILNMTSGEAFEMLKNENFDVIIFSNKYDEIINDNCPYMSLNKWDKITNKMLCGFQYLENKEKIDTILEVDEVENNMWIKKISNFEKTIVYKRKITQ